MDKIIQELYFIFFEISIASKERFRSAAFNKMNIQRMDRFHLKMKNIRFIILIPIFVS